MEWANGWWRSPVLDRVDSLGYLSRKPFAVGVFIILAWILTKQKKVFFHLLLLYAIQSASRLQH